MKPFHLAAAAMSLVLAFLSSAAEPASPLTAGELAARLSTLRQNGASYVRVKMDINGAKKEALQLQIKERRSKNATDVVYQVLWPKERKGESVLLRKSGDRSASGSIFTPPNTLRTIDDLKAPLLGSDLSYEDIVEDFFAWDRQAIVGTEAVGGVSCQLLESKPGKGERSSYGSVKSWIDTRRMVPLRVEKYSGSGQLIRRIDTTRVVSDAGHHIPANLTVSGARQGSSTELDGTRIKHDVALTDRDFTTDGIKEVVTPRGSQD